MGVEPGARIVDANERGGLNGASYESVACEVVGR